MSQSVAFIVLAAVLLVSCSRPRKPIAVPSKNSQEKPRIEINYCCKCKWSLRAGWLALEILQTFDAELESVSLVPSLVGGTYTIVALNDGDKTVIFDRRVAGRFPEAKEIKVFIRDAVFPDRQMGKCLSK